MDAILIGGAPFNFVYEAVQGIQDGWRAILLFKKHFDGGYQLDMLCLRVGISQRSVHEPIGERFLGRPILINARTGVVETTFELVETSSNDTSARDMNRIFGRGSDLNTNKRWASPMIRSPGSTPTRLRSP